jgi:twitching motility protein PilT
VEFIFEPRQAIINQRQVLSDTLSFDSALRAALRQDPDVIMVGEIRDRETMQTALRAAETGHLVLGTLHTKNAQDTITRVIHMFRPEEAQIVRILLASNLSAVVSMRLMKKMDSGERVAAVEILIQTPRTEDLIKDPLRTSEIQEAMAEGRRAYQSQTFDQSLFDLYQGGTISLDVALANASDPDDFKLRASGISQSNR